MVEILTHGKHGDIHPTWAIPWRLMTWLYESQGISSHEVDLMIKKDIDGLVQECSNSSALAMELLHSCSKPSNSTRWQFWPLRMQYFTEYISSFSLNNPASAPEMLTH